MSEWGAAKARRVLAARLRLGWSVGRQTRGSDRVLSRSSRQDVVFAFHESEGVAQKTGLEPADL